MERDWSGSDRELNNRMGLGVVGMERDREG